MDVDGRERRVEERERGGRTWGVEMRVERSEEEDRRTWKGGRKGVEGKDGESGRMLRVEGRRGWKGGWRSVRRTWGEESDDAWMDVEGGKERQGKEKWSKGRG